MKDVDGAAAVIKELNGIVSRRTPHVRLFD